jgi:hypothetical protein
MGEKDMERMFKQVHTATITFASKNDTLINQIFKTPITIRSIKIEGNLYTGDRTVINLSDRQFAHYGTFEEYFDLETKTLTITCDYAEVRIGTCIIVYEGARYIKSTTVGSSAPLQKPVEMAIYESAPADRTDGQLTWALTDIKGRLIARLYENDSVFVKDVSVTTTPSAIDTDTTVREAITLLADSANNGIIYIGNSTSQLFPLTAGASLTLKRCSLSKIYAVSSSATQTLHVIGGGV